jgi:hypothetical protein
VKKMLIGLLALGSVSAFAVDTCKLAFGYSHKAFYATCTPDGAFERNEKELLEVFSMMKGKHPGVIQAKTISQMIQNGWSIESSESLDESIVQHTFTKN